MNTLEKTTEMFIGHTLQQAREKHELTIEEVASKLNLTKDVIQYLESDNYVSSNRDVFYRGYLRAYCNMLLLPADELVQRFSIIVGVDAEAVASISKIQLEPTSSKFTLQNSLPVIKNIMNEHSKTILSVAGLLLFILVVRLWFVGGDSNQTKKNAPVLSEQPVVESVTVEQLSF